MSKFVNAFEDKYPTEAEAVSKIIDHDDGNKMAAKARKQLLNSDTYAKIGNTMYCIFDDFGPIDAKSWTAYYKGSGPMPTYNPKFKGDICGIVEALDKAGENIDSGVEPHIALEVKQATGKDDEGSVVKYSDFSAFYAPSVGEQIVNWYNK